MTARARLGMAVFLGATVVARVGAPCAVAVRPEVTLETASESALIVWDAATKREHFIRGATFSGSAKDAAFLVPTPSKPELSAVSSDPFSAIAARAQPAHETRDVWSGVSFMPLCLLTLARSKSAAIASSVEVVSRQRVGAYDATVLRGDDPAAVVRWLGEHGYPARPALVEWLTPYTRDGFYVTAFRLAEDPTQGGLAATTVRLSFDTPTPFYPYREPSDAPAHPGRLLRLAFVGPFTPDAQLGGAAETGEARFVAPVFSGELGETASALPVLADPSAWLTVYDDRAETRRGLGDLTLRPTSTKQRITPPPIIDRVPRELPLPIDVVGFFVALGAIGVIVSRRLAPA